MRLVYNDAHFIDEDIEAHRNLPSFMANAFNPYYTQALRKCSETVTILFKREMRPWLPGAHSLIRGKRQASQWLIPIQNPV